jgi:hypothetical protein
LRIFFCKCSCRDPVGTLHTVDPFRPFSHVDREHVAAVNKLYSSQNQAPPINVRCKCLLASVLDVPLLVVACVSIMRASSITRWIYNQVFTRYDFACNALVVGLCVQAMGRWECGRGAIIQHIWSFRKLPPSFLPPALGFPVRCVRA